MKRPPRPPHRRGKGNGTMARKLIDQEEAARILGVSPEEIGSLRDRKKLFPYRDGDQWKFKQDDVERLRNEMQADKEMAGGSEFGAGLDDLDLDLETPMAEATPKAAPAAASSAAGDKAGSAPVESAPASSPPAASAPSSGAAAGSARAAKSDDALDDLGDLDLNEDLDSILLSEAELGKPAKEGHSTIIGKTDQSGSDDDMVLSDDLKVPHSNLEGSGLTLTSASGIGIGSGMGSDVKLVATGSDVAGKPPGTGSSDKLFGSDALSLSDDELSLVAPADSGKSKPSAGSSIKLDDDADVLGGKPGSDVTQSPTDSGIMLISPSDSGLSLDEPLALGSSAKQLLDLGEEGKGMGSAAGKTGIGLAPGSKIEDDFQLSSADEPAGEDSDSGSQVIALDSDDDISSGMFAPVAQTGLVEEEPIAATPSSVPGIGLAPSTAPTPTLVAVAGTVEAPFSTWNVTSLAICAVFLLLCGMMTYDLLRNMWSWQGPTTVNSSIMDSIGNSVGWFEK